MNRLGRLAAVHQVKLLDPETTAVVSRERARQQTRHRSRSKSIDRLANAVRSKSPLRKSSAAADTSASGSGRTTPTQRSHSPGRAIGDMWRRVAGIALRWSRGHYRDHLRVTGREHMSDVDCFDGEKMRKGRFESEKEKTEDDESDGMDEDLLTIHPVVDGRLKDEGRK